MKEKAAENQRLIELGSSISSDTRASSQKVLSVPRLAQGDPAWGSARMKVDGLIIHFVVAKGYMNDVIVISNPGPQNDTSLAQYLNAGYTLKSVVCFKK